MLFYELSKPLKEALHYVVNELNKGLYKLEKAIVHLRNSFRYQQHWPRLTSMKPLLRRVKLD